MLRQLIAEAGDGDLTWLSSAGMLDALCRAEVAFEIKRRGERVQWVLNPFRDRPDASGYAETIDKAIDALVATARIRYGEQWARTGSGLS